MAVHSQKRDHTPADFAVPPPDARLIWLLPGIAMLATLIGAGVLATREPQAWVMVPAIFLIVIVIVIVITLILHRRRISIEGDELVVAAGVNTRRIAIGDIDLSTARLVDLREHKEWKPLIKLLGTRVPGLSMGHFRLRDRSRAFVLLTDQSRVLVLTERSGRRLVLSLARPQALLDALQSPRADLH